MLNSTGDALDFVAWAALVAERSPRFRRGIDKARRLAAGEERGAYPRSGGPLTLCTWVELEGRLAEARALPEGERPRAWKNTERPANDALRHVYGYLKLCRRLGARHLGGERAGPLVHELVCGEGYRVSVPGGSASSRPVGSLASTLAAHITGESWGAGATALRQAWYRHRPSELRHSANAYLLDAGVYPPPSAPFSFGRHI